MCSAKRKMGIIVIGGEVQFAESVTLCHDVSLCPPPLPFPLLQHLLVSDLQRATERTAKLDHVPALKCQSFLTRVSRFASKPVILKHSVLMNPFENLMKSAGLASRKIYIPLSIYKLLYVNRMSILLNLCMDSKYQPQ